MIPPFLMLTIKKQAANPILLLAVVSGLLLSGCKPAGQRDLMKGEQLVNEGRFADAVPKLKDATEELTRDPLSIQARAYNLLGVAYQGAGDPKMAIESYKNALKLDNSLLITHYNLGAIYLDQGNYSESIKSLTAYTKENSKDADAYVKLATAHLRASTPLTGTSKTDQLNGAKKDLEWAIHLAPTAEAFNTLGMVELQRSGVSGDALKHFNEALQKTPNYAPALLNVAIYYQTYLNDHKQALEKYNAYLALSPRPANAADVEKLAKQLEAEVNPKTAAVAVNPVTPTVKTNAPDVAVVTPTPTQVTPTPAQLSAIEANNKAIVETKRQQAERDAETARRKLQADADAKKLADARAIALADAAKAAAANQTAIDKQNEAARLAKIQADKIETDRLAKIKAEQDKQAEIDRVAKLNEASRQAEAVRLAKVKADEIARQKADADQKMRAQRMAEQQAALTAATNAAQTNVPTPTTTPVKMAVVAPPATNATPKATGKKPGFFGSIGGFVKDLFSDDTNEVQVATAPEPPKPVKVKAPEKPKKVKEVKVVAQTPTPTPAPATVEKPKEKKPKKIKEPKTVKATPIPDSSVTNTESYPPLIELPVKGAQMRYTYHTINKPAAGNKAEGQRLTNAGIEAQRQEHLMESIADYQNAIQADPSCFEGYFRLSLAAHEASDFPTALYAMENALAIQPDSVDARYAFAWTLHRGRYSQDAANELEKLVAQKRDETRAHLLLANIYAQQLDQPKLAKEHYTKVLEQDPNNAQAVAIRYWLAGNP